jgi:hypothetical protein
MLTHGVKGAEGVQRQPSTIDQGRSGLARHWNSAFALTDLAAV